MKNEWLSIFCAFFAFTASAQGDELTGTISNIDLTRNTFEVEGRTFTAPPQNTVGIKLKDLREGDKVTVELPGGGNPKGDALAEPIESLRRAE